MLLQADMKVPREWKKKLLPRGKTNNNLAAYYTKFKIKTAKIQSNRNKKIFISCGLKDRVIKATKGEFMDISELQEEANTRMLHASVAEKCLFSFSLCITASIIIIKMKIQMRSNWHSILI